jgi:hypothetical protein
VGPPAHPQALILPNQKEPQSTAIPKSHFTHGETGLILPERVAWQNLYDKWKKSVELSEKQNVVQWEFLSSSKKAYLATYFAPDRIEVKSTLPPDILGIYKDLSWGLDPNAPDDALFMEFRHREDVTISDPNLFYQNVVQFAKRAGIETKILNPQLGVDQNTTLHFHISVKGRNLAELGEAFNDLALIRKIHSGELNDLTSNESYIYEPTATQKGLVRIIARDRLEFRAHSIALKDELNFILEALSHENPEALNFIHNEIRRLMNDYVAEKLMTRRSEYVSRFLPWMTPDQQKKAQAKLDSLKLLDQRIQNPTQDLWDDLPKLFSGGDNHLAKKFNQLLLRHPWPESFLNQVPSLLNGTNPVAKKVILNSLHLQQKWPEDVYPPLLEFIHGKNGELASQAAYAISSRSELPAKLITDAALPHLRSPSLESRVLGTQMIKNQKSLPKAIWDRLPELIGTEGDTDYHKAIRMNLTRTLENQTHWPQEFWDRIPSMMKTSSESTAKIIMAGLSKQKEWPEAVWQEILPFTIRLKSDARKTWAGIISKQARCPSSFLEKRLFIMNIFQTSGSAPAVLGHWFTEQQQKATAHCLAERTAQALR